MRLLASRIRCRAIGTIEGCEERISAMRALVNLSHSDGAEAEALVRLMTGGAGAAICSEALKKRVRLMDVAGGTERSDVARRILKSFEIGYHQGQCCSSGQPACIQQN